MKIYAFDKSFLQRIEEFSVVLEDDNGSTLKDQWIDFLESSM